MRMRSGRIGRPAGLGIALILIVGAASAAESNIKSIAAGLGFENFTRTVVWSGDEASSKITASRVAARANLELGQGLVLSLSAGLSFTDFENLTFSSLPISLEYGGSPVTGFTLGAEIAAPLKKFGDFEIGVAGRFVYSFGMSKTWPLEGFAVEGEAGGGPNWMEVAAGPRLAYLMFNRVRPFIELSARWFWAEFRMTETLGELAGTETKRVKGDFAVGATLGADADIGRHIEALVRASIMPFAGGVDSLLSIGVLYKF
jgi:hypothetical protein